MARPRAGEPGYEQANEKWRKTMAERFGGEENVRDFFRRIGAIGGRHGHTGGFNSEKIGKDGLTGRQRSVICGRLGGKISRRGPAKKVVADERDEENA